MKNLNKTLLACAAGLTLMGAGSVQADFSFGDSNFNFGSGYHPYGGNPYWSAPVYGAPGWGPGWGQVYRPWGWGPPAYGYPWLSSFDRSTMKHRRQRQMSDHHEAMNELRDMLYTDEGFDRTKAVQIVRKIEATSGESLTGNFHPGSVVTTGSHTTLALLNNQEAFKANAKALQAAAAELAKELEKRPTAEEGAIYLPKERAYGREEPETEAVSPTIWEKFQALSDTCVACHSNFRGRGWW